MQAKLINIGNSKGLRIPRQLIKKYHLKSPLDLEEIENGILIKSDLPEGKMTWEDTFKDMGRSDEDWSEWDSTAADGLEAE